MKYFKDSTNKVYAYEADGSQDSYIPANLIPITLEEADELRKLIPPEPTIPTVVSMRQARLALLQVGMLGLVQSAIDNGSQEDKITWEFSTEVARDFPVVQNFKTTLGLSEEQLDSLFTLASSL